MAASHAYAWLRIPGGLLVFQENRFVGALLRLPVHLQGSTPRAIFLAQRHEKRIAAICGCKHLPCHFRGC